MQAKSAPPETSQEHRLLPKQYEFAMSPAQFAAYMGGIGSGKSHAGMVARIAYALEHPGATGAIVGPTLVNLRMTTMRTFFRLLPRALTAHPDYKWNKTDRLVQFPNGSEFFFLGSDDETAIERIRGLEVAHFHIDEGPLCPPLLWLILIGRLRQPGFPLQGRVTGTHKGFDWVYEHFEFPKDGKKTVGPIWHASIRENPHLAQEYLDALYALYSTEYAKQELEGGHAKFEGLIYGGFDRTTHVIAELPKFKKVVYLVDFGYWYAPVLVLGVTDNDQYVIAAEWYGMKVTPEDQIEGAKSLVGRFGPGTFWCDPAEPGLIEAMRRRGLHAGVWEPKRPGRVEDGIGLVQSRLQVRSDGLPGLVVHESCVGTIAEFEAYEYAKRPLGAGSEWKDKPAEGQLDHAMDDIRYGVVALQVPAPSAATAAPGASYRVERPATTSVPSGLGRAGRPRRL